MNAAVIFDVDGVLVDSYAAHFQSWRLFAAEHDYELSESEFASSFGRTSREVLTAWWPDRRLTPAELKSMDDRKEELFREIIADQIPEMPGARVLWRNLLAAGFRIGVGSSGPPKNVQLVMQHLDPQGTAGAVITGADVTKGKPDPQVFQLAAEELRTLARDCVVVEDAPAGIVAAHAADMKCIALVSTGRKHAELNKADWIVSDLSEVTIDGLRDLLER